MPHYRFSADAMTEFSLVASFELYFLHTRFSVSVFVYGLGGSAGFDLLNPLPVFIKFDDSIFLFWAWTDDSGIISSVLMP